MDREAIRTNVRALTLIESTHVSDTFINDLINQGLHEISAAYDWPFCQTSANLNFTANTRTVALPATFLRAIALVDDDHDNTLQYVSNSIFFKEIGNDTGNTSTQPSMWTIFGSNIYLSPIPSAADTARVTLYFYSTITELSTDSSVPVFPQAYHWMLVEYCKWKLYEREEYYDQSEAAFASYSRYMNDMIAFFNTRSPDQPAIYGGGFNHRRGHPNIPWWNNF